MSLLENLNDTHACVRYVSPPQPVSTLNEFPPRGRVTIGELPDNVLLNIFRYYLDDSPRYWPRLVHICRRWRRIVFTSPRALHLRLFCTHGTSVSKTLGCWPTMPIAMRYGGHLELDPPCPEDEDNIILAALKQPGRVDSISLTVTSSLLEKLSSIMMPFSELEDLVLLSRDSVPLTLPSAFLSCPRLRCLHLTGTAFPAILRLLYSTTNLVDLQLHDVLNPLYFSPEVLTDALSGMAQLRSLSLHPTFTANYDILLTESWGRRVVLPVLSRLNFRGISQYLERFVAGIDAPRLTDIEITLLNENIIGFPKLLEFIDRTKIHKPHRRAHIRFYKHTIFISLTQTRAPARFKLRLPCEPPRKRLLFTTRLCAYLSDPLINVERLRISTSSTTRPSGQGDRASGWRDLLNLFTGVQRLRVAGNLSTNIVRALKPRDRGGDTILPSLHTLYIAQPGPRRAPLREAVVSSMVSRRLSGRPIGVEYERLCHIGEPCVTGPLSQQVTVEMLSDDIFLDIFRYHLDAAPRTWPTLTFVCQRWRQIVHTSPLSLNLRLYFTPGTPILNALDCWPALPIAIKYGGFPNLDPPAPEDDDNIIAALKQSGRVSSVSITVTNSLLDKISAISEPFSELEELFLLSGDNVQPTLPSTFRWGPRLHTLHSTRVAFPSLPQLLSPSHDLVDIQLHEIPSAGYFSPEALANALSGMTHLRTLSFHFLSLPPRRNYLSLPPLSEERVVLPALTFLKYRGTSKYLDSIVARIDAPVLANIDITFFFQPTMDASQLGRFIERTGIQTPLSQAEVQMSGNAISISFTSSGSSTPLRLQIACKQLDWQLSSMAQVCDQFSPLLSSVNNLRINMTQSSSGQNDVNGEQWLELIRAFGGATDLRVASELTTAILCALGLVEGEHVNVLPFLENLHIENPTAMDEPSRDALRSFVALRSRSGHHVQINVPFNRCHICHASIREEHGLNRHLIDKHAYLGLCLYCTDFEYKPGHDDLFRKHLKSEHFTIARKDPHVWYYYSTPDQIGGLITRHGFVRAPDTVAPSTTVTAPHSQ